MKPFNLEEAMAGKPIVCRDGTPAKFISFVPEADTFKLVVLRYEDVITYTMEGQFGTTQRESPYDLFMAIPPKKVWWINFYERRFPRGPLDYIASRWDTEKVADENAGSDRVGGKAHRIEV